MIIVLYDPDKDGRSYNKWRIVIDPLVSYLRTISEQNPGVITLSILYPANSEFETIKSKNYVNDICWDTWKEGEVIKEFYNRLKSHPQLSKLTNFKIDL